MTDDESFVRQIREDPQDEVARLIYADYLEESGDPRGEFIRVQCELARREPGDAERIALAAREQELLDAHAEEWLWPLRELGATGVSRGCFQRGLIERVRMDANAFFQNAVELCRIAPALVRVDLRNAAAAIGRRIGLDLPEQLTSFDLSANRLDADSVGGLTATPWFARITELNLQLNELGDSGAARLGAVRLARLEVLRLGRNGIGPDGVRGLLHAGNLPSLKSLSLAMNPLTSAGAQHLARAPALPALEELDLSMTGLDNRAVAAMGSSGGLWSLKRLVLRANAIDQQGAMSISVKRWQLERIDLRGNPAAGSTAVKAHFGDRLVA